jgi:hypothetical protein
MQTLPERPQRCHWEFFFKNKMAFVQYGTGSGLGPWRLTFFPPKLVRRCNGTTAGRGYLK